MPVVVRDFDMPFGSMVWVILKWSLASIPALIVLFIVGSIFVGLLAAIGLGR